MAKKRANGEGNIRKRADGRWEGRYTAGYHPETGKRIIKNVLGKTQAECKAKLSAAMEATRGIEVSRADEYTVATWLRTWFELYAKPHIRPSTMNYYYRNIEQHIIPAIGDIPLNNCVLPAIFSFFMTPISDFFESSEIGSRVFGDIGLPTLEHTSPFRRSTMRKGRKKRALRIAEKLLVRLLTQYFPLTSDSTLGGWCA